MKLRYAVLLSLLLLVTAPWAAGHGAHAAAKAVNPPECLVTIQRLLLSDGAEICVDYLAYYGAPSEYSKKGEPPTGGWYSAGRIALPYSARLANGSVLESGWYHVMVDFKPGANRIVFTRNRGLEYLQSAYEHLTADVEYRISHADTDRDGIISDREREFAFNRPAPLKMEDVKAYLLPYSGGATGADIRSSFPESSTVVNEVTVPLQVRELDSMSERSSIHVIPGREAGNFILQITFGRYQGTTRISLAQPSR